MHYKWIFCLYLFIWICKISVAISQDESREAFNDRTNEEDIFHRENNDLNAKQLYLKKILHEQLERVSQDKRGSKVDDNDYNNEDNHNQNDDNNNENQEEDEEEEEGEYDPWRDSFQDQYEDGTYVYGYTLPNGVTRFERSFYSEKYKGLVVEGFYTEPRYYGKQIMYELHCYRSDYYDGFRVRRVQYLRRPPVIRRDEQPNVNCVSNE